MPRPVYIICSESGSEDAQTGLVSHYHVIEKLRVVDFAQLQRQGAAVLVPTNMFRATAVWMRTEDDPPEQEFEFETAFYMPPDGEELVVQKGRFFFTPEKPLYRMMVSGQSSPLPAPGLLRVENRVRRVGAKEWIRQDFPIIVETIEPAQPPEPTPTPS